MTMDELNALYNKMSVYDKPAVDNMSIYGDTVAPDVNALTGIETIPDPIEDPFILPILQGGGDKGQHTTQGMNYSLYNDSKDPFFKTRENKTGLAGIFEFLQRISPTSNIMKLGKTGIETAQNWYADKKAKEKIQKEKDLMAEIQADNLKAAMQAQQAKADQGLGYYGHKDYDGGFAGNITQTGPGRQEEPGGGAFGGSGKGQHTTQGSDRGRSRGRGETGQIAGGHHFDRGGRIRYGEGGIVTL